MVSGVSSGVNPLSDYYKKYTEAQSAKTNADSAQVAAMTAKTEATSAKESADTILKKENADVTELNSKIDSIGRDIQALLDQIGSLNLEYKLADEGQQSEILNKINELNEKIKNKENEKAELEAQLIVEQKEAAEAQTKYEEAVTKEAEAVENLDNANIAQKEAIANLATAESEYTSQRAELEKQGYEFDEVGNVVKEPETEKTEGAKETDKTDKTDFTPMTEAEAVAAGYTVIPKNCSGAELLKILQDNMGGKFILMGDIDLEGINWTPVGNAESPFTGEFNGNGFDINNLKIEVAADEAQNIGLFGVTENALIQNANLVDAIIEGKTDLLTGTENAGLLIGLAKGTTVNNITASGEVSGSTSVGGLIGQIDDRGDKNVDIGNSLITNCHTDVIVESQFYAGGLVGYVHGTEDRSEDHRGVASKSLIIRDCTTTGSATVGEESVGGLIGESDKTIITLDRCSSDMDLTWSNLEDDSDLSFLLETGRIGGMVGNINGSYITIANCEFEGSLNGDTEFQSEVYGWYMDDSHVTIYDLPAGLPVNDILNISGIDGMTFNESSQKYECTVSTMSGLDKMVAMIKANPSLADQVEFIVNFDFNAMDGQYTYSEYAQYGIVQELYEDENGQVHNDVYIDNEIDLETTFHCGENANMELGPCSGGACCSECEPTMVSGLYKTMIPGLDKDEAKYYVQTDEGLKEVTLKINADGQQTNVQTRLTESEVRYREYLTQMAKLYQDQMYKCMRDMFGLSAEEELPIITKAEYKKLLKKAEKAGGIDKLSKKDQLAVAVFEADYDIMNAVSKATKNLGCGMGGNASFLDKTKTHQMYTTIDGIQRALYTNLKGDQLVQKLDSNGKPIDGEYEYADGSGDYDGFDLDQIFEQRGLQNTDENGNLLFTDEEGNTVTQKKGEDGNVSYVTVDADGNEVEYSGDPEKLGRQLTPYNNAQEYDNIESEMKQILSDVQNGKYPKGRTSGVNEERGDNSTDYGQSVTDESNSEPTSTNNDELPSEDDKDKDKEE